MGAFQPLQPLCLGFDLFFRFGGLENPPHGRTWTRPNMADTAHGLFVPSVPVVDMFRLFQHRRCESKHIHDWNSREKTGEWNS